MGNRKLKIGEFARFARQKVEFQKFREIIQVLSPQRQTTQKQTAWFNKSILWMPSRLCPLPGKCRVKNVVYKAEIKNVTYIGMTSTEFRGRVRRHKHSFMSSDSASEFRRCHSYVCNIFYFSV